MIIDNLFNVQHLEQIQNYPFVVDYGLFDLVSFVFHYSQTSPQHHS